MKEGDIVSVNFTVKAGKTVELSLVSYKADAPFSNAENLQYQVLSDLDTGIFTAGKHCLTVCIPKCYFQLDFVGGKAIDPFGPAGSNILYGAGPSDRLRQRRHPGVRLQLRQRTRRRPHDRRRQHLPRRGQHRRTRRHPRHPRLPAPLRPELQDRRPDPGRQQPPRDQLEPVQVPSRVPDQRRVLRHGNRPGPPKSAPIDTLQGVGDGRFSGTFNGKSYKDVDAKIEFTLTDGGPTKGEPGINDTSNYRIIVLDGNKDGVANDPVVVLDTKGAIKLTFGNHQRTRRSRRSPQHHQRDVITAYLTAFRRNAGRPLRMSGVSVAPFPATPAPRYHSRHGRE